MSDTTKTQESPNTDSDALPPKPEEPQQGPADGWIDRRVKSWDADGKLTGKGTIIRVVKKSKGGKKWEVKWDDEYNYCNGKYNKKQITQMLL